MNKRSKGHELEGEIGEMYGGRVEGEKGERTNVAIKI